MTAHASSESSAIRRSAKRKMTFIEEEFDENERDKENESDLNDIDGDAECDGDASYKANILMMRMRKSKQCQK